MYKENEKISVIVPVYNVEKYIAKCLESILEQTYSNLEVICIDDGSQDASGMICDEYQKKDSRVKVYHVKNGGVSRARNYGLSLMRGSWFCFVDADDWLDEEYIRCLLDLATQNACDIVACDLLETYRDNAMRKKVKEKNLFFETTIECVRNFICTEDSMHGRCINKLYCRSKFGDFRFCEEVKINEDCLYTYAVMQMCGKACYTNRQLYFLRKRRDSACHSKPHWADFSAANVFITLYDLLVKESYEEEVLLTLQVNYVKAAVRVLLFAKYNKNEVEVCAARKRCQEWKEDIWNRLSVVDKLKYYLAVYRC